MKLYEINQEIYNILSLTDEAGEIPSNAFNQLDELLIVRDEKIDNTVSFFKSLLYEAEAIKQEEANLRERRSALENRAERIKYYLANNMNGEKWESPRNKISWRRSESVVIENEDLIPADYREPQPDKILKVDIKKAIKDGLTVSGASIQVKNNIQIK